MAPWRYLRTAVAQRWNAWSECESATIMRRSGAGGPRGDAACPAAHGACAGSKEAQLCTRLHPSSSARDTPIGRARGAPRGRRQQRRIIVAARDHGQAEAARLFFLTSVLRVSLALAGLARHPAPPSEREPAEQGQTSAERPKAPTQPP